MIPAIFSPSGLALTDAERGFFAEVDPAGYILFGRNVESREQVRALTDELRSLHGSENLLISIDQEGGRVARMKPPVWDAYPPGGTFASLWDVAPASAIEAVRANAELIGRDLAEVGINVDYLPLLDVRRPEGHDVIGDRALGSQPMQVAALGRAVLDGLARAGVTGCIKHIPGHGRAVVDSHKDLPIVEASDEELAVDISPFATLSGAPIGMSAHVIYTAWDADNPATQSRFVIEEIIRGRIGFSGLLLTDDIDMEALDGTVPERAERAIAAGCDVVLNCWAKMDDMSGIAARLPAISGAAAARLAAAIDGTQATTNGPERAELLATRDALLAKAGHMA